LINIKMPTSSSDFITLCYDDYPDQREFVFSIKGRPFSMLSSQRISVPSTSLIDFNLVNDLGLKMTDLQCSKFTYGGQKFRILGKISQTVQTITNGVISGTVHLRASVVEGLRSVFDSHSVAGKKFSEMLNKKVSHTDPPASPSISPPSSTPSSSPSSTSSSPPSSTTSPRKLRTPTKVKGQSSPPGFSARSKYPTQLTEVTSTEPSVPTYKPPPGYVRTLQLKPPDTEERMWRHGRVIRLADSNPQFAIVHVYNSPDDPSSVDQTIYRTHCYGNDISLNDVVLFETLFNDDDEPWAYVNYNEDEVRQLKLRGVKIPDCLPENLSRGNCG